MKYFAFLLIFCTGCTHRVIHYIEKSSVDQIIEDDRYEEDEIDFYEEQLVM